MRWIILILMVMPACLPLPYEPLCSKRDVCENDLDKTLEGIAVRDGDTLHLYNGKVVTVRVMWMRVQAQGDDLFNTSGLCGLWNPTTSTITLARAPGCDLSATLLHEVGHAMGLQHSFSGVMAHDFAGPVSKQQLADFRNSASLHLATKER